MSKGKKSGSRGEILDELSSIRSLLGDAAEDVEPGDLEDDHGDDDIPLLPTEADGDAHTQIPLLGSDATEKSGDVRKVASSRQNPFLSSPALTQARQARDESGKVASDTIKQPAERLTPKQATPPPPAESPALNEQQIRALVDEILAAWMPKIERELRARLIDELKSKS